MNRGATTPLGEAASRFFDFGVQQSTMQKYDSLCVLLGLSGLLRALESEGLLASVNESELESVFYLLSMHLPIPGASPEISPNPFGDIDIMRCVAETSFDYHQYLVRRRIEVQSLYLVLGRVLKEWCEPWGTPIVVALLDQQDDNELGSSCVAFVAQADPQETGIGTALLSNAFYETVKLEGPWAYVPFEDILHLTQHFETVPALDGQDDSFVTHVLLQRLLHSKLFCSLLIMMARTQSTGALQRWRGINAGYVARFWGEHIIHWGRKMLLESESGDDANHLREFFESNEETVDLVRNTVPLATDLKNLLWQAISQCSFFYGF